MHEYWRQSANPLANHHQVAVVNAVALRPLGTEGLYELVPGAMADTRIDKEDVVIFENLFCVLF